MSGVSYLPASTIHRQFSIVLVLFRIQNFFMIFVTFFKINFADSFIQFWFILFCGKNLI